MNNPTVDNRCVVDLNKVQAARFGYRSSCGCYWRDTLPSGATNHNVPISSDLLAYPPWEGKTMLQAAVERGLCDKWIPFLTLELTANRHKHFTGEKAKSLWKEWNRRIFKKK